MAEGEWKRDLMAGLAAFQNVQKLDVRSCRGGGSRAVVAHGGWGGSRGVISMGCDIDGVARRAVCRWWSWSDVPACPGCRSGGAEADVAPVSTPDRCGCFGKEVGRGRAGVQEGGDGHAVVSSDDATGWAHASDAAAPVDAASITVRRGSRLGRRGVRWSLAARASVE